MSNPFETAVYGDGVLTIPVLVEKEKVMSVDIAPGVAQAHLHDGLSLRAFMMAETQGNIQNVNNLARLTGVKQFNEVGTLEGKAVQGVTAIPHGAPVGPNGAG